ncbi:MAG TPA: hypothetical protein VN765_14700 [Candidatus Acidoferrum sp.]|nr:hypothetical protein [Candidatus Acidoferrum sp.]
MFDLDLSIMEWRRTMALGGVKSPEVLAELESHLREDVEQQRQTGMEAAEAFETAVQRIGQAAVLEGEFDKVGGLKAAGDRVKQAMLSLAGIPNHYLDNNMNTSNTSSSNIEPRLATYLKAAAFGGPALCLYILLFICVLPKLKELCYQDLGRAFPAFFTLTLDLTDFVRIHLLAISAAIALILGCLEWRSSKWPRYRRAAIGIGIFILNLTVLITIGMTVLIATVVANDFLHHAQ